VIKEVNPQNNDLILMFRLPRGNYATVFLRELLKSLNPELDFA
jgi:tRNA pseudouridine13 synthase